MKRRFFAFAVLSLALTACNGNDDESLYNDGRVAAEFNAAISTTRVNSEGTQWSEGDCIGITGIDTDYSNIPYVLDENATFAAKAETIYFTSDDAITFRAYYPYQEAGGTVSVTTDAANQGSGIDFLFASGATGSMSEPQVNFRNENGRNETDPAKDHSFRHCMSLIKFYFMAGDGVDFSENTPSGYTVSGLKLAGSFNTETGEALVNTEAQAADLAMTIDSRFTSQIIVFPQEATDDLTLTVQYNGQNYTAKPTKPSEGSFQAGSSYTYNVIISNTKLEMSAASVAPWENGSTDNPYIEL